MRGLHKECLKGAVITVAENKRQYELLAPIIEGFGWHTKVVYSGKEVFVKHFHCEPYYNNYANNRDELIKELIKEQDVVSWVQEISRLMNHRTVVKVGEVLREALSQLNKEHGGRISEDFWGIEVHTG
mmetsp:Transcript_11673/g.21106  ORF Transcript_11673/g.21106 Transcript_11673/m.21106 type:complete len:128 (-) Transcript_11673:97-480(-)